MIIQVNNIHLNLIEDWEKKNAIDLSLEQHALLLVKGIHAVEKRSLMTLSNVTVMVIIDRVLSQVKEKFPLVSSVILGPNGMCFDDFFHNDKKNMSVDLLDALRDILFRLLSVLGRITADILTLPLHKELLKVIWNDPEQK